MDLIGSSGPDFGGAPEPPEIRPRQPKDRKTLVAVVVAALAGIAVLSSLFLKAPEPEPPASFPRPPVLTMEPSRGDDAGDDSRLYASAQAPAQKVMTLDEFMGTLETEAPPVARVMAEAFKKEPRLSRTWNEYRKESGGGSAPAAEFMRRVRPTAEFKTLLARFKSDPGFQSAFMKVMQNPETARVMMGQVAPHASGVAAAGPVRPQNAVLGARAGTGSPAMAARGPGMSFAAAGPSAAAVARGDTGATGYQANASNPAATAGPEAHDATPLKSEWKNQTTVTRVQDKIDALLKLYPCMKTLDENNIKRLAEEGHVDTVGLWGACFKLRLYDQCAQASCSGACGKLACRSQDETKPYGCWQGCLDSQEVTANPRTCIQAVRLQPGCATPKDIPTDIWTNYCVQPTDGNGLFTRVQDPPFAECGVQAVDCTKNPSHTGCRCGAQPPAPRSAICGTPGTTACLGGQSLNTSGVCACPTGKSLGNSGFCEETNGWETRNGFEVYQCIQPGAPYWSSGVCYAYHQPGAPGGRCSGSPDTKGFCSLGTTVGKDFEGYPTNPSKSDCSCQCRKGTQECK